MNINMTLIGQTIAFAIFCLVLHKVCVASDQQRASRASEEKLLMAWTQPAVRRATLSLLKSVLSKRCVKARSRLLKFSSKPTSALLK